MTTKRFSTRTPGISYRLHPTRKYGVNLDKYYSVRVQVAGTRIEEGVGWASEGWTEKKVAAELAEIRANITTGAGPRSLKEKRMLEDTRRQNEIIKEQLKSDEIAHADRLLFDKVFQLYCEANNQKSSIRTEKCYYRNWIAEAIGNRRLDQIILLDLERIKMKMQKAGRTPRTVHYIKSIVRQVYNFADDHDLYSGIPPTKRWLKKLRINNKRQRFLTPEEAELLLAELGKKSPQTYRITLLALYGGMRFGEIAALQWQHINLDNASLTVAKPKNNESRQVFLNTVLLTMFQELKPGKMSDYVFPNRKGGKLFEISSTFALVVRNLRFNEGVTDNLYKVVFHTLRHTHGTWLRKYANADVLMISKSLGHKTLAMSQRYTKVDDPTMREAMQNIKPPVEINKIVKIK